MDDAGITVVRAGDDGPGRRRRWVPWAAAGTVAAVAVAGGVAAAQWYFSDGPQPAEVLPASTLAYASINLDPSGEQQLAARDLLERFPLWDEAGVDSDDDIRQWFVDDVLDGLKCDDLDYDDDLAPWVGDRVAVAAVPVGSADEPHPVVVVEQGDEDDADASLQQLRECSGRDDVFWDFVDGWVVVGPTQETVDEVVDADETLADDDDYQDLVGTVGGPGLVTAYVAPGAFEAIAPEMSAETGLPPETLATFAKSFGGLAASLQVEDSALEVEIAGSFGPGASKTSHDVDGDAELLGDAPSGTALAFVLSTPDGWARGALQVVDQLPGPEGQQVRAELASIEAELGEEPADFAERLLGDVAVLVVGDDPSEVALRIVGADPGAADAWSRLGRLIDDPTAREFVQASQDGDVVVVGPDADYRAEVMAPTETLADSGDLDAVLPDLDTATGGLYVDFGSAFVDYLLERAPQEVRDNVAPLDRAGFDAWVDDDGRLRERIRITVR